MVKIKYFPNYLYQVKLGNYFISPFNGLKIDSDMKTLWLDLEISNSFFKKNSPEGGFNFKISRISYDSANDFDCTNIPYEVKYMFQLLEGSNLSIPKMIDIIMSPDLLGDEQNEIKNLIKDILDSSGDKLKLFLIKFLKFIEDLPKENLPKLLDEPRYTCIFGDLNYELQFKNNVITRSGAQLDEKNISPGTLRKYFSSTILSKDIFIDVFVALGLDKFLASPPSLPETGGSIFIDMGGTGKSMIKAALQKFWNQELGGICIEKNGVAEFTADTNYARLIRSWYYGSTESDGSGYDKEGLFGQAIKNKIPSLLIIDEADRFVKTEMNGEKDNGAEMIITEFKKYLTGRDKGGVQGYVITLFIANVNREDLTPQLSQGGERLSVVYFGPPTSENEWLSLINIYFKKNKLEFEDRNSRNDLLLAKLLLFHNSQMPHERFMISPRRFGSAFCGDYLSKHNPLVEEENLSGGDIFDNIHNSIFRKSKTKKILYNDFLKNIIEHLLLIQVEDSKINVSAARDTYFKFIGEENHYEGNEEKKSSFSVEEKEELDLILNDQITQRIMSSTYFFEILGITSDAIIQYSDLKRQILFLKARFASTNKFFKDGAGRKHQIKTKIALDLLSDLDKKILPVPKEKIYTSSYISSKVPVIDFSKYS